MGASLLGHPGTSLTLTRALQSWCKQSQKLGASFAQEVSLRHEAARFVMINVYDEEEPQDERFRPQGARRLVALLPAAHPS